MVGQKLRKGLACLIGSCSVILLAAPDASGQGAVWSVRAGGGLVNSPNELSPNTNGATLDVDAGVSFAFDVSRTLTPGLEVQIGVLGYRVPIEWREPHRASTNGLQRSALTIGVMVDLLRLPATSVYAGPLLAGTNRSSAYTSDGTQVIRASGAVGVGVEAGMRWPGFVDRKRLALDANIKWLVLREPLSTNTNLGDPIITTIGLLYRF